MPCRCDDDDVYASRERSRLLEKVDDLTQKLCWLCGTVCYRNVNNVLMMGNPALSKWWEEHQRQDKLRLEDEMRREAIKYESAYAMAQAFIKRAEKEHPVSEFHKFWMEQLATDVWGPETRKARKQKETREGALAKLTATERKLLGV